MVEIADIRDEKSFRAWLVDSLLEPWNCVALAARAAARALPLFWAGSLEHEHYSALPVLRALLVADLSSRASVVAVTNDRCAEGLRKLALLPSANAARPEDYSRAFSGRIIPMNQAYNAANSAYSAADSARFDNRTIYHTSRAASFSAGAFPATNYAVHSEANWEPLRDDCLALNNGTALRSISLWSQKQQKWVENTMYRLCTAAENSTADWSFWLDWYQRFLDGRSQNWPLLLEIALQDDDFWQGSDVEVNARIAEITTLHEHSEISPSEPTEAHFSDLPRLLPQAIENTFNSERIVETQTGQFDVEPITEIDTDAFTLGLRRTGNLLDDIAEAVAKRPQLLSALPEAIQPLAKDLTRSADLPYLIYQALLRAAQRIQIMCRQEELPSNDYEVEDFRQQLRSIALDILVNDPQVKKALDARIDFHLQELTEAEQADLRKLGTGLAEVSTPRLGDAMVADSRTATGPLKKDGEARKGAVYQFSSRLFRMMERNPSKVTAVAITVGVGGIIVTLISMFV